MSTYFDGSQLRAIDSDAAADGEPMSAALEAQLANDHHYLHRVGAGSVVKLGTPVGTGQTDDNLLPQASVGLSSLHYQPFLVTRGLSEVRIDWHGIIEGYDLDVRLELRGFGAVDATWVQTTGNEHRTITLTLPAPAEYEFEVDLILWQIGRAGALDGTLTAGRITEGVIESPSTTLVGTDFARCMVSANPDTEGNTDLVTPYETLARLAGTTGADGASVDMGVTNTAASGSSMRFVEAELARVAMRSLQITQRHA